MSAQTKSAQAVAIAACEKKPLLFSAAPEYSTSPVWETKAQELENHYNSGQISKIYRSTGDLKGQIENIAPDQTQQDSPAISKICSLVADANYAAGKRAESKLWYELSLKFDKSNQFASSGLKGIQVLEGNSDAKVNYFEPVSHKPK